MPGFGNPSVWLRDLFKQAGLGSGISLFLSTITLVAFVSLLSWLLSHFAPALIIWFMAWWALKADCDFERIRPEIVSESDRLRHSGIKHYY